MKTTVQFHITMEVDNASIGATDIADAANHARKFVEIAMPTDGVTLAGMTMTAFPCSEAPSPLDMVGMLNDPEFIAPLKKLFNDLRGEDGEEPWKK